MILKLFTTALLTAGMPRSERRRADEHFSYKLRLNATDKLSGDFGVGLDPTAGLNSGSGSRDFKGGHLWLRFDHHERCEENKPSDLYMVVKTQAGPQRIKGEATPGRLPYMSVCPSLLCSAVSRSQTKPDVAGHTFLSCTSQKTGLETQINHCCVGFKWLTSV